MPPPGLGDGCPGDCGCGGGSPSLPAPPGVSRLGSKLILLHLDCDQTSAQLNGAPMKLPHKFLRCHHRREVNAHKARRGGWVLRSLVTPLQR